MESPKKIYLTEGDEYSGQIETTWGEERITDEDVEYVRADIHADLEKRLAEPPHPDCFYHSGRGCNNLRLNVPVQGKRGLITGGC